MTDLWTRLEQQLRVHAPGLFASLRSGADKALLKAYEDEVGHRLPSDLREAYLRHDGCALESDFLVAQSALGLFGRYRWLPLSESLQGWRRNLEGFDDATPYSCPDDGGSWRGWTIRPWLMPPPSWFPLAQRRNPTMDLYCDVLPGPAGVAGQLVGEDVHGQAIWLEASSMSAYLTGLLEGLEQGRVVPYRDPDTGDHSWVYRDGLTFTADGYSREPFMVRTQHI